MGENRPCLLRLTRKKTLNSFQNALVHVILALAARPESSLGNKQRMVPSFNDVQFIDGFHLSSHTLQEMQWAEPVTCALHEQDWRA